MDVLIFCVTVLSVLVVVLLGWQLYNVLYIERRVKNSVKKSIQEIRIEIENRFAESKKEMEVKAAENDAISTFNLAESLYDIDVFSHALTLYIKAVYNISFTEKYQDIEEICINRMVAIVEELDGKALVLPTVDKQGYVNMLDRLKDNRKYVIINFLLR